MADGHDGNAEQIRKIADVVADAAISKFSREKQGGLTKLEWGVIISLVTSVGTLIFTAGIMYGQVQGHDKEINALRSAGTASTDRLARIETKLDLLVNDRTAKDK